MRKYLLTALLAGSFNVTVLAIDTGASPWEDQPPNNNFPFPRPPKPEPPIDDVPPPDDNSVNIPEIGAGAIALCIGTFVGGILIYRERLPKSLA